MHTILGVIENSAGNHIGNCDSLVEMRMKMTKPYNFTIVSSPKLSYDTIAYFVKNSVTGASVTLHKDVFAKLTGDTSNAVVAALSADELKLWTDLAELAAERGVGLVTN